MPEPLGYEFQMTAEFCRAAIGSLEQVLWMQNERFYRHLESRMRFRSQLRVAGIVFSVCGSALALLGWDLRSVRMGIATPAFICVFRSPLKQRPAHVLYVPGPREHAALSAALVAAGVQLLQLPGACAGMEEETQESSASTLG